MFKLFKKPTESTIAPYRLNLATMTPDERKAYPIWNGKSAQGNKRLMDSKADSPR